MRKVAAVVAVVLLAVSLPAPLAVSPLPVDPSHTIVGARSGHPGMESMDAESTGEHGVPVPTDPMR